MSDHRIVTYSYRLRSIMRAKGFTLRALALRANVDRAALRRIRDGRSLPSWRVACRLADVLGVELTHMIGRKVRRTNTGIRPDGALESEELADER